MDAGGPAGRGERERAGGEDSHPQYLFLFIFKDDAKINAPSLSGNGVVQPRQSFAVSGATRGRGSASEVTTCLGSIWPPASGTSISPGRGWTEPGWEREKKKKLAIVPRAPTVYEYKCLIYSSLQPAKEILSRFMETELQNGMEPAG